jgi:hypothetical protein
MSYPIFSLQDVDPRSNENSYTNDPVIMKQALDAREAKRKYYEEQNKRIAAGASVVGGGISLIPHPATKIIGGLLQVPDIYYDVKDNVNNPSSKTNWVHTALDFGSQLRHIIPGQIDDIFLQIPGAIDDSYNAMTGRNIITDTRRKLSTIFKNKRSIKDKENNKKN